MVSVQVKKVFLWHFPLADSCIRTVVALGSSKSLPNSKKPTSEASYCFGAALPSGQRVSPCHVFLSAVYLMRTASIVPHTALFLKFSTVQAHFKAVTQQ